MALYDTDLPIRADLAAAHAELLDRWVHAGTTWSSAERCAIVAEVRTARRHRERPPWEAPSTVEGLIEADHPLPAAAIDAIWRLTNHPGTLTAAWYQTIIDRGLRPERYVELVGVVAQANSLDRFADGLGIDRVELPTPTEKPGTGVLADEVAVRKHWVPTAEISGPNVLKALSAVPAENTSRQVLSDVQYVPSGALLGDLSSPHGALSRLQIEVLAARTSKLNECFY